MYSNKQLAFQYNFYQQITALSLHHIVDPVLFPSTELAEFHIVIVFNMPRHFVQSHASSFTSPYFFISFSTCFFHVCFGLSLPLLPLTLNFKAFAITFSSSILKTLPYHRILLALAIPARDAFMPKMSINFSLFLRSNSFTPHIARIIALSVLLKIAISFSLKHHASLPYNITDLAQLLQTSPFIFNENLLPLSISLHFLIFIQPILVLAVIAVCTRQLRSICHLDKRTCLQFPHHHTVFYLVS